MLVHLAPPPDELGNVLDSIRLKGELPLPDGGTGTAQLCRTRAGLWLCAGSPKPLVAIDLLASQPVRYEPGRLGDCLVVGGQSFGVPTGKGASVRRAISLGRLPPPIATALPPPGRLVEPRSELHDAWLAGWLGPDELLLGWLATSSTLEISSPIGPPETVSQSFVLTTTRAALVAVSSLGDTDVVELPEQPLIVKPQLGRDVVECGALSWRTSRANEAAFAQAAPLASMGRQARSFAAAEVLWSAGKAPAADSHRARELLGRLHSEQFAWAQLTQAVCFPAEHAPSDVDAALTSLLVSPQPSVVQWIDWATTWAITSERLLELAARLRALGRAGHVSLALEQFARMSGPEDDPDLLRGIERDGSYAEHLAELGQHDDARTLLESSLARLPAAELFDLLPPTDDAIELSPKRVRLRALERIGSLAIEDSAARVRTRLALAQLQPLDAERIEALCALEDRSLAARAADVCTLLGPGGLEPLTAAERFDSPTAPLTEEQLFERVQHPVARSGGALGKLQRFLASVETPDHSALKSYCEQLGPARSSAAQDALTDAVLAFGVRGLEAYVSRGDKSVGFRAHEGKPPFLLIGGDHLDPGSPSLLRPAELRFAIGAEVAHLRFGHARVTSSDVWSGTFTKGREAAALFLTLLPVLKLLKMGGRIAAAAEAVPNDAVSAVVGAAARLAGGAAKGAAGRSVDRPTEELVAAHRVTQFTADRAGLLLAGDLRSALRALLLTRPEYAAELDVSNRLGLTAAITRLGPSGAALHPDLPLRVGALIAFFLSDDYPPLRQALAPLSSEE